jgi:serine/threonine-protein kinase PknG
VGRGRGGRPGREQGTCPWCGAAFDLTPTLAAGTSLTGRYGRYVVRSPLVRGGRGWLYAATSTAGDQVVLSRLEGPEGRSAGALAAEETEVLLALDIPGLVRARDVVTATEPDGPARHLVLDHVAGTSLGGGPDDRPWAPMAALDAVIDALPTVVALHDRGLLHADLGPANLMRGPGGTTVMDLGSLRRRDDRTSDVWATTGFVAPEIAPGGGGPSERSDVFALGRTLAVLVADFDHTRTHALRLPDPATVPVLREQPELYALLARATAVDPADRHPDVAALAAEARSVRAALAARGGRPAPRPGDEGVGVPDRGSRTPEDGLPARSGETPRAPRSTGPDRPARNGVGAPTP